MHINLEGKTALVCGSTQGIGLAIAHQFATSGARVVLFARNEAKLKGRCKDLPRPADQEHSYAVADFAQPELVKSKLLTLLDQISTIHILVNNTGGPPPGPIAAAAPEDFLEAYKKHLVVNQILVQSVLPGMKMAGFGRIINIISTSVKSPIPGLGVSNTTRGAVASWAKTLAGEVASSGITVNNILPGFTDTQRLHQLFENNASKEGISKEEYAQRAIKGIPAGRLANPEELGFLATFLASEQSAYLTGISIAIDGGRTNCL